MCKPKCACGCIRGEMERTIAEHMQRAKESKQMVEIKVKIQEASGNYYKLWLDDDNVWDALDRVAQQLEAR